MRCHLLLPGALPDPEIEPRSPALQADSLASQPPKKPTQVKGQVHIKEWKNLKDRRLGSDIKRRPLEVKLLCNSQAKVFNNILLVQIMNWPRIRQRFVWINRRSTNYRIKERAIWDLPLTWESLLFLVFNMRTTLQFWKKHCVCWGEQWLAPKSSGQVAVGNTQQDFRRNCGLGKSPDFVEVKC